MARIFSWQHWRDTWRAVQAPQRDEPSVTPSKSSEAFPDIDTSTLEQSMVLLQREAVSVFADWQKNRNDQDALIQAFVSADGHEGKRRSVAEERIFVKGLGRDLEERYHAIQKHLRLLNGITLLLKKRSWLKAHLSPERLAGLDIEGLQTALARAVAQGEADDQILADMLNILDASAAKAELRRDIALRDELGELEALARQDIHQRTLCKHSTLESLSDDLQNWIDCSLKEKSALAGEKRA